MKEHFDAKQDITNLVPSLNLGFLFLSGNIFFEKSQKKLKSEIFKII